MCADLDCGVCYRTYTSRRRCPRLLQCKHSFCESCLRALLTPERDIVCPMCRRTTPVSGEIRAELPVDEGVLEQLGEDPEEEEEEEGEMMEGEESRDGSEGSSDSSSRGGRLSWRNIWKKIRGKSSQQSKYSHRLISC